MPRAPHLLALSLLTATAGCVQVFPDPPPPPLVFSLRADPALTVAPEPMQITLAVATPTFESALAGPELVARRNDGSYAYVDGARWTAPGPSVLQSLFVETLNRTQAVRAAIRADGSARSDYILQMDVTAFELERERRTGEARFAATARLVRTAGRRAVATRQIEASTSAGTRSPAEGAQALESVARQAATETIAWALAEVKRDQDASAASTTK